MLKKNLPGQQRPQTSAELFGHTWPKLHDGKKWYVDFYAVDPALQQMRRKKYYIPDNISAAEKRKRGAQLVRILTDKLASGWNPWLSAASSRAYTDFEEVLTRYLDYIGKGDRIKTVYSYSSRVNILRDYIAHMPVPIRYAYQYDTEFVTGFLDHVYLDRSCGPRTRNNYRGWCSALGEWMVERKYIESNPCATVQKVKETPKQRKALTPDMLRAMNDYLSQTNPHFLLACMMEYYTFIRPTELSHMRIGDISVARQCVTVPGSVSKNKRDGAVGLNKAILDLMVDLELFNCPSSHYVFGKAFHPAEKRKGPDHFNKEWAKMRKHLGWGSEYQFYSLKDSGIRDLANDAGIVVARDQARHSDVSTTNKYLEHDSRVHEETKKFKGGLG